jgi:hypothetical protein
VAAVSMIGGVVSPKKTAIRFGAMNPARISTVPMSM